MRLVIIIPLLHARYSRVPVSPCHEPTELPTLDQSLLLLPLLLLLNLMVRPAPAPTPVHVLAHTYVPAACPRCVLLSG